MCGVEVGRWIVAGTVALLLAADSARAQVAPAQGVGAQEIATSSRSSGAYDLDGLVYNPDLDSWLTINRIGAGEILEITRLGAFATAASGFGAGAIGGDGIAPAPGMNLAFVVEGHAREVYVLNPGGAGAARTLVGSLAFDPNGPQCPELAVAEEDETGDLIVAFGPASPAAGCAQTPIRAPADWFRVTATGGSSFLFMTDFHVFRSLSRDPAAVGRYFAIDVYDGASPGLVNLQAPTLAVVELAGTVRFLATHMGMSIADIEVDRSKTVIASDVIWAIKDDRDVVTLDPATGALGGAIASTTGAYRMAGIAVAPATRNRTARSLYALVTEDIGGNVTAKLFEIGPGISQPGTGGSSGSPASGGSTSGGSTGASAGTSTGQPGSTGTSTGQPASTASTTSPASSGGSSSGLRASPGGGGGGGCAMTRGTPESVLPLVALTFGLAWVAARRRARRSSASA